MVRLLVKFLQVKKTTPIAKSNGGKIEKEKCMKKSRLLFQTKYPKKHWKLFQRSFAVTMILLLSATAVLCGILWADAQTRAIGFADTSPALFIKKNEDHLSAGFMGSQMDVNLTAFRQWMVSLKQQTATLFSPAGRLIASGASALFQWIQTITSP